MKLECFECTLADGKKLRVVADAYVGGFGIHHRIFGGRMIDDGWSVSHMASGRLVWTVEHREDALKVAQWLHLKKVMPADAAAFAKWSEKHTTADHAKLVEKLSSIAPRLRRLHDAVPYGETCGT